MLLRRREHTRPSLVQSSRYFNKKAYEKMYLNESKLN
jgi:hypothetical protein